MSYPDDDMERQTVGAAATGQTEEMMADLEGDDEGTIAAAQGAADDSSEAPEEDNQSALPDDPRPANMQQPPFREQY